jgi:hypothetical protein
MEAKENEIIIKALGDEITASKSSVRSHNPGLRALLAIKNFSTTLENDYAELLQIESDLDMLNKKAFLMIEATKSPEAIARWNASLHKVITAITGINDTLVDAKKRMEQKTKEGYPELWKQLAVHLVSLKDNSKNAAAIGFELLPETFQLEWEKNYVIIETPMVHYLVTHVESCRVLLQMIERYTTDELTTINQIIVDQIPLDFTYQEAIEYQNDYYKALVNFKKEFKEEKNLWDTFLDILAGGTHQTPSERVMMERWLDGEKGDL